MCPAACLDPVVRTRFRTTQAAAMLVKGLTASSIVNRVFRPQPGHTILIHAAASGVGMLLCQWSKHLGATVIGTVGLAREGAGGMRPRLRSRDSLSGSRFRGGGEGRSPAGVDAVFDGVGKDTFIPSLDCVRPFGMLVNYGNASGHVPPLDLLLLAKKGSLSVSRPGLSHFFNEAGALQVGRGRIVRLVAQGVCARKSAAPIRCGTPRRRISTSSAAATTGSLLLLL